MWKPSARGWGVVAVVVALVVGPSLSASASAPVAPSAVVREDYPTWDQVNAAKANEQAKQAEVANIRSLLDGLEQQAAELTDQALQRGQEYLTATYNLDAATQYATTLAAQAADATAKAEAANTQVGQLAAQLYRSGGDSTLNLILNQNDSDSLLYQLGTMAKLTEQSAGVRDVAVAAQNTADALTDQAEVAKAEQDRLTQEASDRLDAAKAAQAAVDAQVAATKDQNAQLLAQLASLNNTTVEIETKYNAGVAYRAAEAAKQAAAAAAADAPGSAWVPDGTTVASAGEAQAYAASQMGAYGWSGGQFDCLVALWTGESGWRANAYNESSGAYGIPQSLPASKMASAGSDYITNAATQINWGLGYIADRYGSPCNALSEWQARDPHWY